jgi:hypothetical protein
MKQIFQILFVVIISLFFFKAETAQSSDEIIQLNDLVGIWTQDTSPEDFTKSVIKFREDGTYTIAYDIEKIETGPVDKGQIKFEGIDIVFIPSESPMCTNNSGKYAINKIEKDKLELTAQEDTCERRRAALNRKLIRINQ